MYRLDPASKRLDRVIETMQQPNGLAFSANEEQLFVVDLRGRPDRTCRLISGASTSPRMARRSIAASWSKLPSVCSTVSASTMKIASGRAPATVCIATTTMATCLARSSREFLVINLCFGGPKRNILYMCTPRTVLRVPVRARGQNAFRGRAASHDGGYHRLDARRRPASSAGELLDRTLNPSHRCCARNRAGNRLPFCRRRRQASLARQQ